MEIQCGEGKIHYEVFGKGTPILFIHGWPVDMRLWTGCIESIFLKNRDLDQAWERIYIDLPGRGSSPAGSGVKRADDELSIVEEFIGKIIPEENFALAGESYGGYLSLGLLKRMAERILGVFLLCPQVIDPKEESSAKKRHLEKLSVFERESGFSGGIPTDKKEQWEGFSFFAAKYTREAFDAYCRDIEPGLKVADWDYLNNRLDGSFSFNLDDTNPFSGPSLILTGKQDNAVGFRNQFDLLERFPRASYAALDIAGHNLQCEQIPLFNAFVENWLERMSL